uniref:Alcohol dehydrogenase-like N-terminal domain-containing protein n=1 Tax=Salix viminalis TaxID=40686 RepID=A0A6N2KBJ1_SALVM
MMPCQSKDKKACGVCHSDLHVIKGEIPFPSPCAIGHEITGEVVEHGKLSDRKTIERAFGASDIIAVDVQDEKLEKAKTFGWCYRGDRYQSSGPSKGIGSVEIY